MSKLIILHADILTSQGILPDAVLIVENKLITHLQPYYRTMQLPPAEVLDADGLLISPGWIDIQINGAFGEDFTQNPKSIWDVASRLPQYGVTSFLPTIITSPLEIFLSAIEIWKDGPPPNWHGAIPLGFHFEGPFLNPGQKGAHNPQYLRSSDLDLIPEWQVDNGVRMVTLAPELPGAIEMIGELRKRGIVVSAGHTMATYEQALTAFNAGIGCATHLYNAMPELNHRAPGITGAVLINSELPAGLIADGIHSHPFFIQLAWKWKGAKGIILVSDAMAAMGMPFGEYNLAGYPVYVDESGARLKDGRLAGSILTLPKAVQNIMEFCELKLGDVLPSVTSTPAQLLGLKNKGRIDVGCDADLTLLNYQGEIKATIVGGRIEYASDDLNYSKHL